MRNKIRRCFSWAGITSGRPLVTHWFLVGRLANEQTLTAQDTVQAIITRNVSQFTAGLAPILGIRSEDYINPFGNPVVFQVLESTCR